MDPRIILDLFLHLKFDYSLAPHVELSGICVALFLHFRSRFVYNG